MKINVGALTGFLAGLMRCAKCLRQELVAKLESRLSAIGSKIFREDDCHARDRGWQVIPRHGGLSRTYRDPRFDHLVACAACNGNGCDPDGVTCSGCHGTGRITVEPATVHRLGRGQP